MRDDDFITGRPPFRQRTAQGKSERSHVCTKGNAVRIRCADKICHGRVRGFQCGITFTTGGKGAAVIGILMGTAVKDKKGVPVREVTPKGPSEKAGMKNGDVILSIEGEAVNSTEELKKAVGKHDAGETITVVVQRKEEQKTLKITLGYRELVFASMKTRNDKLSGKVSVRRTGFEKVIQHEVTLAPSEMGGPLLDLNGRLLGINIARRNRVEFFALPASLVQKVIKTKAAEIAEASKDKTE